MQELEANLLELRLSNQQLNQIESVVMVHHFQLPMFAYQDPFRMFCIARHCWADVEDLDKIGQ